MVRYLGTQKVLFLAVETRDFALSLPYKRPGHTARKLCCFLFQESQQYLQHRYVMLSQEARIQCLTLYTSTTPFVENNWFHMYIGTTTALHCQPRSILHCTGACSCSLCIAQASPGDVVVFNTNRHAVVLDPLSVWLVIVYFRLTESASRESAHVSQTEVRVLKSR